MDNKYITLLQRMIQTPSISGQEDVVCTMLAEWMTAEGCTPHRIGNNLWAECGQGETILLNAHIDTVKPAASYTRDPFGGECDGTTIYGLGANALDPEAVKKIFLAKGRPADNPLIVHIDNFEKI